MTVNSILVPTDFSETSEAALRYATQMALTMGARLYLMHVPGKTGEHFEANFPIGRFETAARERLASFLTQQQLEQLRPEYALRVGTPAEEIVRYADACYADLIIMGTHGLYRSRPYAYRQCGRTGRANSTMPGLALPPFQARCRFPRRRRGSHTRHHNAWPERDDVNYRMRITPIGSHRR